MWTERKKTISMRWQYFSLWFGVLLSCGLVTAPLPLYKIAWQAPRGPDAVFSQFNATFAYVGDKVGVSFDIHTFEIDSELQAAAGGFDFFYGGPTLLYCVILTNNIQPLATLVSTVQGVPVDVLSGSIIASAGSSVRTLADIEGKVVAAGQFTGLTTFQSELYLLIMNNVSLFTQTKAVVGYPSTPSILDAVTSGAADVGFTQTELFPPSVQLVDGAFYPNQALPSTTNTYSSQVFAAAKAIPNDVRTSVTEALLSMKLEAAQILQAGNYSGWNVPQSFIDIRRLGQATGLISPTGEKCSDLSQAFSFIECPPGFRRKPDSDIATNCLRTGYVCPANHTCVCSPCVRITQPKHIGPLTVGAFSGIAVAIVSAALLICLVAIMRRRNRVAFIPWAALDVDTSDVLGQTRKGLVLKGYYKNRPVACQRAYPRTEFGVSSFDTQKPETIPHVVCLGITIYGTGQKMAAFLGIPTGLSRRGRALTELRHRDHPNVLSVLGASKGADGYELIGVTEFAPRGTLQDLLDNKLIDVPTGSLLKLALDVARGLLYLHSLAVPCVGTELTACSILITESFGCQLTPDICPSPIGESSLMRAPEFLRGGTPSASADMYSFGMLLYHVTHREEPFADCDTSFVAKGICDLDSDELIRPIVTRTNLEADIVDFMTRCWRDDPAARPSAQAAVELLSQYSELSLAGQLLLEASQQRALLQQMLPDHVVRALQEDRPPSSRTFDMVTIFFSDIKGFTNISSSQTPEGVMRLLDELYTKFDAICNKHDLMKVETIGDS